MKRTMTIVVAIAVALSMAACDALDQILQVNLFAGLAAVSDREIMEADASKLVELGKSDSFYGTLKEKPETKQKVLDTIDDKLKDPKATETEKQDLAILGADIHLKTTGGDVVVNKITDVLTDQSKIQDSNGEIDTTKLLSAIMPDGLVVDGKVTDATQFKAIIDGLVAANDFYTTLGSNLGADGKYDDPSVNAGAIAQSAVVAAMISSIEIPVGESYATKGEYLYALINEPDTTVPPDAFNPPDFGAGSLGNLLAAAGLDPALFKF